MAVKEDKHQDEELKTQVKTEDFHKSVVLELMWETVDRLAKAVVAEMVVLVEVLMAEPEIAEKAEEKIHLAETVDLVEAIHTGQVEVEETKERVQMETVMAVAAVEQDLMIDQNHYHGQVEMAQKDLLEFPEQNINKKNKLIIKK
jgi:hypothetical protein